MSIHCVNCHYEGKCAVDKYHYTFFILSTLFLIFVYSFGTSYYRISGSRIYVLCAYGVYFFRPQAYHCPSCHGKYGTPLALYRKLHP